MARRVAHPVSINERASDEQPQQHRVGSSRKEKKHKHKTERKNKFLFEIVLCAVATRLSHFNWKTGWQYYNNNAPYRNVIECQIGTNSYNEKKKTTTKYISQV